MKTCPKCGYARKLSDQDKPGWQCPGCGIAYAKFESQAKTRPAPATRTVQVAEGRHSMSAKALFWILSGVLALSYVGYRKFVSPEAAQERGLAADGTVHQTDNPALLMRMDAGGPTLRLTAETSAELRQLTGSRVVMFATSWCPYCAEARKMFGEQGMRYTEIDIERDPDGAKFQNDKFRVNGVPTIVIGDRLLHGFDAGQILASLKEL